MKNAISFASILGCSALVSRRAATLFLNRLVWPGTMLLLACLCLPAQAQKGEWVWMGGSNTAANQPGVYGTLGTPAAGNTPGGRQYETIWTDSNGHFWLFGGVGFYSAHDMGCHNDLWEFNPSINEWAWMGGSKTADQKGVYGTLGMPAAGNTPGARCGAVSWTDSSGHLWLFGGGGYDSAGNRGDLNDLWEFNPSTNEWAWMGGSSTAGQSGDLPTVYGTLGTPAAGNIPGGRESAASWTDSSGNLWLFGGWDVNSATGTAFSTTFGSSILPSTNGRGWAEAARGQPARQCTARWERLRPETSLEAAFRL